jgi:hypothetical protein
VSEQLPDGGPEGPAGTKHWQAQVGGSPHCKGERLQKLKRQFNVQSWMNMGQAVDHIVMDLPPA